ncbi:hypothetical protein EDB92DRAFT_1589808 [Lactarius akahatsu]|uniref:Malate dehydrogenase n=1 Tax=Lactarius akahatsu TaxID=416441 RepID=A0AAD4LN11_9AGAM|nr:hypothetical protein EDB92DRAFT_1589808 [Lactarius akahatsu]
MFALPLLSLLLATMAFAAPSHKGRDAVPASALKLPSGQTQLVAPTTAPKFVAAGFGNQNYSCTAGGNYTSIGAVAQLFDISPLFGTPEFSTIQDDGFAIWSSCPSTDPFEKGLAPRLSEKFRIKPLGQHIFINFNGALSPKFDFTQTTGNPDNFVVAVKAGNIPAPASQDVDWLELKKVDGGLADLVFRVDTKAGKPPSTCTPGSGPITVKYAAAYWFF